MVIVLVSQWQSNGEISIDISVSSNNFSIAAIILSFAYLERHDSNQTSKIDCSEKFIFIIWWMIIDLATQTGSISIPKKLIGPSNLKFPW